jgi:hypothetical protein
MSVRYTTLHLECGGKGLKLNETDLRTRKLYFDRIHLSSIQVEDLKVNLRPTGTGGIPPRSDEEGA